MRTHEHDQLKNDSLRPKAARVDEATEHTVWRAAAAGRTDVVGRDGMLRLQRAIGNSGVQRLAEEERSPVLDVVSSGHGRPLEEPVRDDMEARFGQDFGDVRVHTDDAAADSARAVGAHAYTVGPNVVFQRDRYDPGSTEGRTMLAHELTHVVQQRSGPVDGTPTGSGVRISDPSDRFEREAAATAEHLVAGPAPAPAAQLSVGQPAGAAVQRDTGAQPDLQGLFVQREAADEEQDTAQTSVAQRAEATEEEPESA